MTELKLVRIDAQGFDELVALTRLQEGPREMARQVLVQGERISAVARAHGVSPQPLGAVIAALRELYSAGAAGGGWALAELELPGRLLNRLSEFGEALRAASPAAREAVLTQLIGTMRQAQRHLEASTRVDQAAARSASDSDSGQDE